MIDLRVFWEYFQVGNQQIIRKRQKTYWRKKLMKMREIIRDTKKGARNLKEIGGSKVKSVRLDKAVKSIKTHILVLEGREGMLDHPLSLFRCKGPVNVKYLKANMQNDIPQIATNVQFWWQNLTAIAYTSSIDDGSGDFVGQRENQQNTDICEFIKNIYEFYIVDGDPDRTQWPPKWGMTQPGGYAK
ncbi:hypothetical protein CEXT_602371 [Caerostris extrusa]|uniref:Uncharacterized protein n=1 Tax=Caerostris extrusa TaxID=172846 RepID=A0AAV4UW35_CAEEX|nr:hypothetical protein CEXT_602371 [Caerostris extrusa]